MFHHEPSAGKEVSDGLIQHHAERPDITTETGRMLHRQELDHLRGKDRIIHILSLIVNPGTNRSEGDAVSQSFIYIRESHAACKGHIFSDILAIDFQLGTH